MASDRDELRVIIGGMTYTGWTEVDLDSDVFSQADSFSITGALPDKSTRAAFDAGERCDIYIGDSRQMAGVIDSINFSGDHSKSRMRVTGRDKGALLIDCEAPPIKAAKLTVKKLIEKLLDPSFQIRQIITSNDANRRLLVGKDEVKKMRAAVAAAELGDVPRASSKIDPGTKISTIIDEHCKRLGIAWWITAEGDLFLGKPSYNQETAYHFRLEEGDRGTIFNNIESWSVTKALGNRASELQVNGMGFTSKDPWDQGKSPPKYKAVATDPDLKRRGIVRKQIIRDTDILSSKEAAARANLEQSQRQLEALTIQIVVPGYRDEENLRLYTVDTIASVKIDEGDIDGTYWLCQRRFRENKERRRTEITLKKKGVWLA